MRLLTLTVSLLHLPSLLIAQSTSGPPGYNTTIPSTISPTDPLSFGTHYALLFLDLINGLVQPIASTPEGAQFINRTTILISAAHDAQSPPPLSIFTRIYFQTLLRPEIGPATPFAPVVAGLGNATVSSAPGQLYSAFHPLSDNDPVLSKTRYYAGTGNELELILSSQQIDTVILAGIRTSGVILSTAYRLFDLNYKVFVVSDAVIETPPDDPGVHAAILEGVIPKFPADVVTTEQVVAALGTSGSAKGKKGARY